MTPFHWMVLSARRRGFPYAEELPMMWRDRAWQMSLQAPEGAMTINDVPEPERSRLARAAEKARQKRWRAEAIISMVGV